MSKDLAVPAGLPVVLVHGIRMNGASWMMVTEQIAPSRPVVAIDLPGHGARRGETFSLTAATDIIRDAIDSVGGRALLVGHSLGGFVSMVAAAALQERVAGLVVVGATCEPTRTLMLPFTVMHRVLSRQSDGGLAMSARLLNSILPQRAADAIVEAGIATEVIPDVVRELPGADVLGSIAAYDGPVWLINGRHDHLRIHEARFVAARPDARLRIVPSTGHYLPLTNPEPFAALVMEAAETVEQEMRIEAS